uniref:Uncharacterized protein n=1 Tax=Oryza brachyantha TaxID=4533 RepID=J3MHK0_ORYBR
VQIVYASTYHSTLWLVEDFNSNSIGWCECTDRQHTIMQTFLPIADNGTVVTVPSCAESVGGVH